MATQPLPSQFRGIYHRVAKRLGVDPSYVSRVARHERRSEAVAAELKKEVDRILFASRKVLTESVLAQVELALTLCKQARKARENGESDNGCLRCARQASEGAFRIIAKLGVEAAEYGEIRGKANRLHAELRQLDDEARTDPSGTKETTSLAN